MSDEGHVYIGMLQRLENKMAGMAATMAFPCGSEIHNMDTDFEHTMTDRVICPHNSNKLLLISNYHVEHTCFYPCAIYHPNETLIM